VVLFPAVLTHDPRRQALAVALPHRQPAAHVGQGESGGAVAAESGTQKGKQCSVLLDRQHLPGADRPGPGRVAEAENLNLAEVLIGHDGYAPGMLRFCRCFAGSGPRRKRAH